MTIQITDTATYKQAREAIAFFERNNMRSPSEYLDTLEVKKGKNNMYACVRMLDMHSEIARRRKFNLNPAFQRGHVANVSWSQGIINSIFKDLGQLPPLMIGTYKNRDDGFAADVMDGKQRLTAARLDSIAKCQ